MSKNLQFLLILKRLCEGRFWGAGYSVHSRAVPIEFTLWNRAVRLVTYCLRSFLLGKVLIGGSHTPVSSEQECSCAADSQCFAHRRALEGALRALAPLWVRVSFQRSMCFSASLECFPPTPHPQSQPCPRSIPEVNNCRVCRSEGVVACLRHRNLR